MPRDKFRFGLLNMRTVQLCDVPAETEDEVVLAWKPVWKTSTCNKEVAQLVKTCHRDAQEPQTQPQIAARRWQTVAVNVSNCEYEAGCCWERAAQLGLNLETATITPVHENRLI